MAQVSPLLSYSGEALEGVVAGRTYESAYELELQVRSVWCGVGLHSLPWLVY